MAGLRRAAILAVGSELLTPSRLDTNSLFITEQLNLLGIEVASKSQVGDNRDDLAAAMRFALTRADLVVCCGGLGPTDDDLTREVVAGVLDRPLAEDERITASIKARFESRRMEMPAINRRQAMVPAGARVIDNTNGTAPGLWLEHGAQVVLLLPGPPRELKPMLLSVKDELLAPRSSGLVLIRRVIKITGRTESHTEEAVQPLYREWTQASVPIDATILASLGQIELHLSARADTLERASAAVDAGARQVAAVLGLDAYSLAGENLEQVLGDLLVQRGYRIACAESCTGGLLASRLTDVPGSSRYVDRAIVAYANEAKIALLAVPAGMIDEHGAVSEPVAQAMARGIRTNARVDVGVGVTGIAGPGGGTPDKPVGTVAVAAIGPETARSRVFRFVGDRELVKFQASQAALDMVRRMLLGAETTQASPRS
jgi:nicotinamide-nucleotide amidase